MVYVYFEVGHPEARIRCIKNWPVDKLIQGSALIKELREDLGKLWIVSEAIEECRSFMGPCTSGAQVGHRS